METLDKMGIKCEYKDNVLTIYGGKIKAFNGKSYNDHRMVMMQAIAASIANSECSIQNIEAIDKSYPTFFEDYKTLGGIYNV
jgi:3-phosphoshikimate 1-carboxyvinyltransferase